MSKKKIFGISTNPELPSVFESTNSIGVTIPYVTSIELAGGIPLLLPPIMNPRDIEAQLELIDVLLLSGGSDIDPSHYGEKHSKLLGPLSPQRDAYELELIKIAYKKKIPIFGICRGLQLLNVAFGGTLYQDISEVPNVNAVHDQEGMGDKPVHTIKIEKSTLLAEIVNQSSFEINSFHHQVIKKLSPHFRVNAHSEDGLIEGIESIEGSLILAVQWHPEIMAATDPLNLKLFQYFA